MKKSAIILALFCCVLTATAQQKAAVTLGSGNTDKETRKVGTFEKISVQGPFDVRLVSGDAGTISVEGDSNIISLVVTEVENGTLKINPAPGKLFKSSKGNKVIVRVPFTTLTEIALNGSGTITGKKLITEDVKLTLDGSGSIALEVKNTNAEVTTLGSGSINIKGSAQNFKCLVAGSGNVMANGLDAGKVDVMVSGSGNAKVYTASTITGRITGSGNVALTGNPKERDLKRTGTGDYQIL